MEDRGELMTVAPARPAKQDRTTMVLLFIAALIAVGGIGFAAGHLTAPAAAADNQTNNRGFGRNFPGASLAPGQTFNPADAGNGFGGGLNRLGGTGGISGTVQSVNGSTLTIQLASGQSVTVDLSGSTTYHGETSATADQVKVGASVTVQIDTSAVAGETPNPAATGVLGGRQVSAKDVLITNP